MLIFFCLRINDIYGNQCLSLGGNKLYQVKVIGPKGPLECGNGLLCACNCCIQPTIQNYLRGIN